LTFKPPPTHHYNRRKTHTFESLIFTDDIVLIDIF
jgi:hypothetical protein